MIDSDWRLREFVKALQAMDTTEKMMNFLEGILTPKELLEIPTRLKIVKMLKKGIPQHQIAEELGIGIATVTRGSKEIQKGNFKYI
jgi:TrpR family trp operon transcriptional repressor